MANISRFFWAAATAIIFCMCLLGFSLKLSYKIWRTELFPSYFPLSVGITVLPQNVLFWNFYSFFAKLPFTFKHSGSQREIAPKCRIVPSSAKTRCYPCLSSGDDHELWLELVCLGIFLHFTDITLLLQQNYLPPSRTLWNLFELAKITNNSSFCVTLQKASKPMNAWYP